MTLARGWYVKGRKLSWPNAERLCSGPFDDHEAAFAELKRIAPLYPDATLDVVMETGRMLRECRPRSTHRAPEFDLRKVSERREASGALAAFARDLGAGVVVEDWDGEPDVDIWLPNLRANIWLAWHKEAPMPIISWHRSRWPLVDTLRGAWAQEGAFRNGKATSQPETWQGLFDALEIGICAAVDGSAFDMED